MKLWRSAKLKIIAATSMVVFTLFACFAGSIAWFNTVQMAANNANQMGIGGVGNLSSINVYRADSASVEGYTFNQTPIQTIRVAAWQGGQPVLQYKNAGDADWSAYTTEAAVNMNPDITDGEEVYEDPFTPLSPYHPLLMVFEYREVRNGAEEKISLYAETTHSFMAPSVDSEGNALEAEGVKASGNPMSSLVHTYAKGYGENDSLDFSFDATVLSSMQQSSFATFDEDEEPVFNNSPVFFEDSENSIKKISIIIEYDADLIEYIYYYYVGSSVLDSTITTVCDWTLNV